MSTGKRLAKRSIVGTRVCVPSKDNIFVPGVICAVKSGSYSVRLESPAPRTTCEFPERDLVGPGFRSIHGLTLEAGQKVFLTHNGREVSANVVAHVRGENKDEVTVTLNPAALERGSPILTLVKRLDEVRLLESRKSARLMDQDTDFARLADMAGADRKRTSSHSIDVPNSIHQGSRKRRPSSSNGSPSDENNQDCMNECTAALVLMSLSCSPHSPRPYYIDGSELSPRSSHDSETYSWALNGRGSSTPSPPLSNGGSWQQDEGVVLDADFAMDDLEDTPRKKKVMCTVFQCTWKGCGVRTTTCEAIERHVRKMHLGPRTPEGDDDGGSSDHEEEFYYTELEVEAGHVAASSPTLSHQDMARPPHEDPEYQRQLQQEKLQNTTTGSYKSPSVLSQRGSPLTIPMASFSWTPGSYLPVSPQKYPKLSPKTVSSPKLSPSGRRVRGESKKCRKVYGMEHREQWCTQCKWKKACTRFGD
ncbi:zinc finger protein 704 [Neocloeon triangulifer]|uniref:zinc finger protein 704 n=1 Tax=Neocloeon triangulifer TaxID=2078957 RepID=UPI00286F749E|nr:zinc finger protein 704 [Neocloeon triangulifer]